ncbi:MAG: 2-oxo acid dehydrogenase subunit E2 [Lentisphaerae bacterium]|nr:2-oxo acid dehydrogenase subunit E2 [Lentisphaerota bacterium]
MAIEITLPRQGWSMEEAVFVEWLKKDGDPVKAGEPLFAVETDKAVQEIESLDEGILRLTPNSPRKDDKVRVADVLGYLVAPGEATPTGKAVVPAAGKDVTPPTGGHVGPPLTGEPLQRRPSTSEGPAGDLRSTRFLPEPTPARPVSPRAARRAVLEGVDLRAVPGTGRGGRIRERDVLAATQCGGAAAVTAPVAAAQSVPPVPGRDEKISTLRRTVADRMHRSKTITAPVTLTTRVDAGALVSLRERLKAKTKGKGTVPAYGDIIMREVAQALLEHPALNARWENDHIRHPDSVNIGFAVDTEAGLVVPVVRDAPKYDLPKLADLTRELAERARARRLAAEEMSGGTFTITNLGMAGIDAFTPIINWPECAVLGVGRITKEPVVKGARVVAGDRLWLSLTFDHRLVDGAPAARFLEALRQRIEAVGGIPQTPAR